MMKLFQHPLLITVILIHSAICLNGQGFRITLSVPDFPEKNVILSHRIGMKFYTDDTLKTDVRGRAVFEQSSGMPAGMYQLVFSDKKFAEFFVDKNQVFGITTRASSPADSLRFTGSPENTRFLEWQRNYSINRNRITQVQNRLKKGNLGPDSTKILNGEIQQSQQNSSRLWDAAIHDLNGTLPGKFIVGLKPVRIPESMGKADTPEIQEKQYNFVRAHFFDGVDFTDESLLRTPLIETKLEQYFKQIAPPMPDTLIRDALKIIELARPSKSVYQYVVQYLFNLYTVPEIMGTDAVYVAIAENYYLSGQTPWIDSANLRGIRTRVSELKPLLLGQVAPELKGLYSQNDQPFEIKDVKSKYLILYFWSPECGFCKEATPKFFAKYPELKEKGIEVIAVNTRTNKEEWLKFINDNKLTWMNVLCPQNTRDMIDKYQAFTTPTLFILDSNRRIIAKSISYEQVLPFFNSYLAGAKKN